MNPSSGSRFNPDVSGAWKHDLYHQHEQQFSEAFPAHSPGTSGGFSSVNSNSHKSRNIYYSKKVPAESSKSKASQNGSSKTARDSEQQDVR